MELIDIVKLEASRVFVAVAESSLLAPIPVAHCQLALQAHSQDLVQARNTLRYHFIDKYLLP